MAKAISKISSELLKIPYYKWQFLRRNENYVKDCEKWSARPRNERKEREIILGYPFEGNLKHFSTPIDQQFQNDVFKYYEKFLPEWNTLNDDPDFIDSLRKKGLRPFVSRKSFSWRKYNEKWLINYPLNPKCEFIPSFIVEIGSTKLISEIAMMGCPNGVFENDVALTEGTESFIKINWAAPREYLYYLFKQMVQGKQRWLSMQGKPPKLSKTRFREYDYYLKVWDLRRRGLSYREIAQKVYPNLDKSDASIKNQFEAAGILINGGYKTIG